MAGFRAPWVRSGAVSAPTSAPLDFWPHYTANGGYFHRRILDMYNPVVNELLLFAGINAAVDPEGRKTKSSSRPLQRACWNLEATNSNCGKRCAIICHMAGETRVQALVDERNKNQRVGHGILLEGGGRTRVSLRCWHAKHCGRRLVQLDSGRTGGCHGPAELAGGAGRGRTSARLVR